MGVTLVNGVATEQIAVADRAVQYGDGVFETISCRDGRPRWLGLHLDRLRRGCERLQLPFDDYATLQREIAALAADQARCLIKLILSRGVSARRGYRPSGDEQATRILTRHDWPESAPLGAAGFRLRTARVRLGINPQLAGLKHLNRLEQVLAQLECARPETEAEEMLLLSSSGHVISGSMSNVFFADEQGLYTPQLAECGVAGVMRRLVFEAVATLGTVVRVRSVLPSELAGVREAFLTNVRWGVQPVDRLDGRALARHDYASQLRSLIDAAHS